MFELLAGFMLLGLLVLVAFALLCAFVRLLVGVVLLPFKVAFWVVGGLLKLGLCFLFCGLFAAFLFGGLVLLPLLPLLLLGGLAWLVVSLLRPSPV